MNEAGKHIYIHVPFCNGKCSYCGLYSEFYTPAQADRYLDCLEREIQIRREGIDLCPETVYVGGGTPSVLNERQLARLCSLVQALTPGRIIEWTMEVGPGTLTAEKTRLMKKAGVSRASIGAQSFDDEVLRRIGRRHSVQEIRETVVLLREAGFENIGVDLIAGLPGVTPELWRQTLLDTLVLAPVHVSVYELTIEPDSRLAKMLQQGEISIPDEETQSEAGRIAENILTEAGFERYELSNYARRLPKDSGPAQPCSEAWRCRHNLSFWRGEDYLGFGPAATSRIGRIRCTNEASISQYIEKIEAGKPAYCTCEILSAEVDLTERVAFCLRLAEGVRLEPFSDASQHLLSLWTGALSRMEHQGLVMRANGRWHLTHYGKNFADSVARTLFEAV